MIRLYLSCLFSMFDALEENIGSCTLNDLEQISSVLGKIQGRAASLQSKINQVLESEITQKLNRDSDFVLEKTVTMTQIPECMPDSTTPPPPPKKKKIG